MAKKRSLFCGVASLLLTAVFAVTQQSPASSQSEVQHIQRGAKVYIEKMDGFDDYLAAALHVKQVPVVVVTDKDKSDFGISGSAHGEMGIPHYQRASIKAVDKDGTVVFAYSFDDDYAIHGKQSAAEACAKNLKKEITGK
jgi:hypothetical protein